VAKLESAVARISLEGSTAVIEFSAPFLFEADAPYHTLFRMSGTSYVIAYPTPGKNSLSVQKGTWNQTSSSVSFGSAEVLQNVKPSFYLTSYGLPSPAGDNFYKGVVVFVDALQNNALTALVVSTPVNQGGLIKLSGLAYGDQLRFTLDEAGNDLWQRHKNQVVPFVSLTALDRETLGIAYSDYGNNGRITAFSFRLNPATLPLALPSPPFVLSGMNPDLSLASWWITCAPLTFNGQHGLLVIRYLETADTTVSNSNTTILEFAQPPIGISPLSSTTATTGQEVPITLSGVFKGERSSFEKGRLYYTSTRGMLVERSSKDHISDDYVIAAEGVLVSLNSRIGLAVSEDELLLINELGA